MVTRQNSRSRLGRSDAESFLDHVWHRKWSVLLILGIAAASAVFFSSQRAPTYEAESRVVVKAVASEAIGQPQSLNMATEVELARSIHVVRLVQSRLGLDMSTADLIEDVSTEALDGTELLILTFEHTRRDVAQDVVQAFAQSYLQVRRLTILEANRQAAEQIQRNIDEMASRLRIIDTRIDQTSDEVLLTSLVSRANLLTTLLVQRRGELLALEVAPDVGSVIQPGLVTGQVSPNYARDVLLAALLGLLFGLAQAALRGTLDAKVFSVEQAEALLDLPMLGTIPSSPGLGKPTHSISHRGGVGAAAGALSALMAQLLISTSRQSIRSVLITSVSPREGKTTIASNLAMALARADRRVILVAGSLKGGGFHDPSTVKTSAGLAEVLAGTASTDEALVPTTNTNLRLVLPGSAAVPGELFHSDALRGFMDSMEQACDLVLIDGPSLGEADAIVLTHETQSVVLVVDARHMETRRLGLARLQLHRNEARAIGVVFNRVAPAMIRPESRLPMVHAASA